MSLPITHIDLHECRVVLPRPVQLGTMRIEAREYVALRLHAADGALGEAIVHTRGTPLFEALQRVAPRFVGADVHRRAAAMAEFEATSVTGHLAFHRARSLLDIALWDLACKAAGQPLWRLLGGLRDRVPLMAVAGYRMNERSVEDVRDEVARRRDEGLRRAKVMLTGTDATIDGRMAQAVAPLLPGAVGADAHWSWTTLAEAKARCGPLDALGLAFIEDPFAPRHAARSIALQAALRTPVAIGEDMPDADSVAALCTRVGVVRLDATTCGGISAALAALHACQLAGQAVLPHIFPALHGQLAGAFEAIEAIEYVPAESLADPIDSLLLRPLRIEDGMLVLDTEPGAALALHTPRLQEATVRHARIEAPR